MFVYLYICVQVYLYIYTFAIKHMQLLCILISYRWLVFFEQLFIGWDVLF